jgi:hypothetical protein
LYRKNGFGHEQTAVGNCHDIIYYVVLGHGSIPIC